MAASENCTAVDPLSPKGNVQVYGVVIVQIPHGVAIVFLQKQAGVNFISSGKRLPPKLSSISRKLFSLEA